MSHPTEATATVETVREPVPLAHHFDDPEQQHNSALLSMWAFLATEVMFFGGLIAAYTIYRISYPAEFAAASRHGMNVLLGAFNTLVLLGSSLSVALAVRSSQLRRRKETAGLILLTIALGGAFLGIKAYEWSHEIREGLFPGRAYEFHHVPEGLGSEAARLFADRTEMFFVLYFFLTGLHGLHMIIGLAIWAIIGAAIWLRRVPAVGERQVEIMGLYWHFVDIVWVFLYPLLYLIEPGPLL